MKLTILPIGKLNGVDCHVLTIQNQNGDELKILDFGLTILAWKIQLQHEIRDILLGYENLTAYEKNEANFNCIIGRYANRIANGTFSLAGETYHLPKNLGDHHLHGGIVGFGNQYWELKSSHCNQKYCEMKFFLHSPHLDQGYPGNLDISVTIRYTSDNELIFIHEAIGDRDTPVNLTNHAYFNLGNEKTVLNHVLKINADRFTETNRDLIPTGNISDVENTVFDFRSPQKIDWSDRNRSRDLVVTNGYDQNFVLNSVEDYKNDPAAIVKDPDSGLTLEVFTNKPGIQFYAGNWLNGIHGKNGEIYAAHSGFCLEAQDFPDAPNHPSFPNTILSTGDKYYHYLKYKISK